jgi:hypothetical protein
MTEGAQRWVGQGKLTGRICVQITPRPSRSGGVLETRKRERTAICGRPHRGVFLRRLCGCGPACQPGSGAAVYKTIMIYLILLLVKDLVV